MLLQILQRHLLQCDYLFIFGKKKAKLVKKFETSTKNHSLTTNANVIHCIVHFQCFGNIRNTSITNFIV